MTVIGWDIGGVNTKAARVDGGVVRAVCSRPFELQRAPERLPALLRELADEAGGGSAPVRHAVTMTAELSQMFRTKREGVGFVLDAVGAAFPHASIHVFATDGGFLTRDAARRAPLAVAAANWSATARLVADVHRDAVLIDIGTTTTDIVPIVSGELAAEGWTDPDRLACGELVYTGALRTPVEAIVSAVPFREGRAFVSAEGFALAGDVHLWRGDLASGDYTVAAPDGRPATRRFAGERLARVICADREMVDEAAVWAIADAVADAQAARIAEAIRMVLVRHPAISTAVVTGVGSFLGARAARAAGLAVEALSEDLGPAAARCASAACVALLLARGEHEPAGVAPHVAAEVPHVTAAGSARESSSSCEDQDDVRDTPLATPAGIDVVVKVGGSLAAHPEHLLRVLTGIAGAARGARMIVVPGGGPFADAVRGVDRRLGLSADAAHWMAVLGMDQYAELIASLCPGAAIVGSPDEAAAALDAARVPVLAASRWMRAADPLPHGWDVTSDSIAAWVAGEVGARRLVLIKAPGAGGEGIVDGHFAAALRPGIEASAVPADQFDAAALNIRWGSTLGSIRGTS